MAVWLLLAVEVHHIQALGSAVECGCCCGRWCHRCCRCCCHCRRAWSSCAHSSVAGAAGPVSKCCWGWTCGCTSLVASWHRQPLLRRLLPLHLTRACRRSGHPISSCRCRCAALQLLPQLLHPGLRGWQHPPAQEGGPSSRHAWRRPRRGRRLWHSLLQPPGRRLCALLPLPQGCRQLCCICGGTLGGGAVGLCCCRGLHGPPECARPAAGERRPAGPGPAKSIGTA